MGLLRMRNESVHDGRDTTTQRLLDAALAEFEKRGISRATMEGIARRAGVTRVTVYRRFADKETLARAVIMREGDRFFADLSRAVATRATLEERIVEGFAFTLAAARQS